MVRVCIASPGSQFQIRMTVIYYSLVSHFPNEFGVLAGTTQHFLTLFGNELLDERPLEGMNNNIIIFGTFKVSNSPIAHWICFELCTFVYTVPLNYFGPLTL